MFPFGGEGSLWILGFGASSRPNPSSGALKSTRPGLREGSSILNVDLVVVTAAALGPEPPSRARRRNFLPPEAESGSFLACFGSPVPHPEAQLTWTQGQILDFSFLGASESIFRVNFRRFM